MLKQINPDQGVVLILDEAQRIATFAGKPYEIEVIGPLDVIHNGNLGKPAILLAAGLGTTEASFGKLGISRFSEGCVVELGALSKESERLVIEDWIKKDGKGQGIQRHGLMRSRRRHMDGPNISNTMETLLQTT